MVGINESLLSSVSGIVGDVLGGAVSMPFGLATVVVLVEETSKDFEVLDAAVVLVETCSLFVVVYSVAAFILVGVPNSGSLVLVRGLSEGEFSEVAVFEFPTKMSELLVVLVSSTLITFSISRLPSTSSSTSRFSSSSEVFTVIRGSKFHTGRLVFG